jgi:hypothetical protein
MHWKTKRKLQRFCNQALIALAIAIGLAIGIGLTIVVNKATPPASQTRP